MFKQFFVDLSNVFFIPDKIRSKEGMVSYFMLSLILLVLVNLLFGFIYKSFSMPIPFQNRKITFFDAIIFAPIIEELFFRAILKKNKINFLLSLIGFASLVFTFIKFGSNVYTYSIFILFILISILIFKTETLLKPFKSNELLLMIYFSSFLFGFGHILNFKISFNFIFPLTLFLIVKTFSGFLLSMLRLKFGLSFSIIFHSFMNLIPFLIINEYLKQ